jgi:hypothetical protein
VEIEVGDRIVVVPIGIEWKEQQARIRLALEVVDPSVKQLRNDLLEVRTRNKERDIIGHRQRRAIHESSGMNRLQRGSRVAT